MRLTVLDTALWYVFVYLTAKLGLDTGAAQK